MLIKDIILLEKVQCRATKFIANDHESDYKARLLALHMLPLMYWLELQDIMFLVKQLQSPADNFNILDYVSFVNNSCRATRSSESNRLKVKYSRTTLTRYFYFHRVARLWNALPNIDLTQSPHTIKRHLIDLLWQHFQQHFSSDTLYLPFPMPLL